MRPLRWFNYSNFACTCGCGLNNISSKLCGMLDIARGLAGIPFVVNSACRCKAHNRAVGGIRNSAHRSGLACDIRCLNSKDRYKIIFALKTAGFTRILIYKTFIHVDIDPSKPQEILTLK